MMGIGQAFLMENFRFLVRKQDINKVQIYREYLTKNGLVKTFDFLQAYNNLIWQIFWRYLLGIALIRKVDSRTLLQISPHFRASINTVMAAISN
jgi:hypothetical protein